jgi:O-antigen/teichoic acid export membrane protein
VKSVIETAVQTSFIASLFCFLLFFFSSDFLTAIFHLQQSSILKIFALAIPFFVAIEILASIFMGFDRVQEKVYFRDMIMNMLKVAFIAFVIVLGYSFLEIIYAYLLSIVIAAIAFIIYSIRKLPIEIAKTGTGATTDADPVTKELLLFSLPLLATFILSIIILQVDTLILGYFKTTTIVGLYNAAHPISQLISVFFGNFSSFSCDIPVSRNGIKRLFWLTIRGGKRCTPNPCSGYVHSCTPRTKCCNFNCNRKHKAEYDR